MEYREVLQELKDNFREVSETSAGLTDFLDLLIRACEKQVAKKPFVTSRVIGLDKDKYVYHSCPSCDYKVYTETFSSDDVLFNIKGTRWDYCHMCGQLLDWETADEKTGL